MKKLLLLFLLTAINMQASQTDAKKKKEVIGTINIVKDSGEECWIRCYGIPPHYYLVFHPKWQNHDLPLPIAKTQTKYSKRMHDYDKSNKKLPQPLYENTSRALSAVLNNYKGIDHGRIPQNSFVSYEVFSDWSIQVISDSIKLKSIQSKL